jgi:hypothetical protein
MICLYRHLLMDTTITRKPRPRKGSSVVLSAQRAVEAGGWDVVWGSVSGGDGMTA